MRKPNPKVLAVTIIGVLGLLVIGSYFILNNEPNNSKAPANDTKAVTPANNSETNAAPSKAGNSTEAQLLYLIEEEKLAHDVYTLMFQKYGATVFGKILESESTRQERVLALLQARNIADPRSSEVGVFKNQDLQTLYDTLIEQGNKNATEAYMAGVAIEEKDIADINTQLATATDQDVITALESLRSASENHLRAFNKQL